MECHCHVTVLYKHVHVHKNTCTYKDTLVYTTNMLMYVHDIYTGTLVLYR